MTSKLHKGNPHVISGYTSDKEVLFSIYGNIIW